MKKSFTLVLSIVVMVIAVGTITKFSVVRAAGAIPTYDSSIEAGDWNTGVLNKPVTITTDADGNIYVVNETGNYIEKFDATGEFILRWGEFGTGNGQFSHPIGIAIDSSGDVYVTDKENNRVQKFSSTGTYISQWGESGSNNGEFAQPRGICIGSDGSIYVADTSNARIQKFTSTGTFVLAWGIDNQAGTGNYDFYWPSAIAINRTTGNVYVVDMYKYRVTVYDSDGGYVSEFGHAKVPSDADGYFSSASGIDIDSSGNIYIADTGNQRIQKFDSSGAFVTKWGGTYGVADDQFMNPEGVNVAANGTVYVADTNNNSVKEFTSTGTFVSKFGKAPMKNPSGVAVDTAGNIYIADADNTRVIKLNSSRNYVTSWEIPDGNEATDVDLDATGNVYVLSNDYGVYKYSSTGTLITQWGSAGTGEGQWYYPNGMSVDATGNVYVVDSVQCRVQKFDTNGAYITEWGASGSADGQFAWPTGINVDESGNVYVADSNNYRIQKFNSYGAFITKWGVEGWDEDGTFDYVVGVTTDSLGNVYTTDQGVNIMRKFTPTGEFIAKWGASDSLNTISNLSIDTNNSIYVANTHNNNIVIYTQETVSAPTVTTTSPATSITAIGATVAGNITSDGGAAVTERGVVYSSVNNPPTLSDSKQVVAGTTGALSASLTGLTANTTYYARAYATNSEGTTYGDVITFKTLTAIPITLKNVYFTFGKLLYGRYAAPSQMRSGDYIYLKNYNPKQVKLLAISLYDYNTKGNQCYSRTWKSTTHMYMKTCGLLPAKRKYAFIFTFQDIVTRTIIKKYFVVNTINKGTITL